jgi:hypothetical protein
VPWALLFLLLLVPMARRLPASYTLYAAATLGLAVTSQALESLERYALGAFPFVVVAATLTERPVVYRVVLSLSVAAMTAYALLTFFELYVP